MQEREDFIKIIRPKLGLDYDSLAASKELVFQNEVLRPILKFQNPLILNSFVDYCANKTVTLGHFSDDEKSTFVKKLLSKDQNFKNQLLGLIVGLMTIEEHKYFLINRKEVSKRIVAMLHERIISQI